jgi:hypothetical protein
LYVYTRWTSVLLSRPKAVRVFSLLYVAGLGYCMILVSGMACIFHNLENYDCRIFMMRA